ALDPASVDPAWAGKIESGATGLARIAALDRDAGDFVGCATLYRELADLVPDDPRWAREAAETSGLAARALEDDAKALSAASRGEVVDAATLKKLRKDARVPMKEFGKPNEFRRFEVAGKRREAESNALFAQTWERYQRAVFLAPLDVQLACDAAHVAIYHVPAELGAAEKLLEGAIRLAREQSESPMEPTAKNQLRHVLATGLSYQGTIEYQFKNNPDGAVKLFEQALEIDPDRLPSVRERLLPEARIASGKLRGDGEPSTADHR
ncbi:MAG TPA: hypothetical protein VM509_01285, partial [Planctomycetota bacterium]|nr:hypothetical protein [Planctomycetota bacterium]